MTVRRAWWLAACLAGLGLAGVAPLQAQGTPDRPASAAAAERAAAAGDAEAGTRLDAMLLLAEEAPAQARAALAELAAPTPAADPAGGAGGPEARREQALLRAWVSLRSAAPPGGADGAPPAAPLAPLLAELGAASGAVAPRLAEADVALVQALLAERDGQPGVDRLARQALAAYEDHCGAQRPLRADCQMRGRWQARQLLAQQATLQMDALAAREHALAGLDLAVAGADRRRQAMSVSQLAMISAATGQAGTAATHLARARALAGPQADLTLQQRLALVESRVAWARGDLAAAGQALQRQLALARQGSSARQQASALAALSDHAAKTGAARLALQSAEAGLALLGDVPASGLRGVLLNNAMLARVALGRVDQARRDFDALQAAWGASGATGRQLESLREFGDALAAAGDLAGALEMHHREQALVERLTAANREAALAALRTRFDREAQQRRMLLLEREKALTAAALANQTLSQRLWAAAGGVLALTAVLLLLLVRRVRETRRRLEHSQASLRVQSERDALTGVAGRRHAQALLSDADRPPAGFVGALMMIDIDHFKQINDGHGHASGDRVLAEVARRIAAAVRPQDLVARWGGEEFLVHAPDLQAHESEALARRLLLAVAGTPVALDRGGALRITVSIGHAVFPLAPRQPSASLEQAVNLVDMALYVAKSQGRHRAVGIRGCDAATAEALRAVEADFERAWQDGRVTLHTDGGPGPALDDGPETAGGAAHAPPAGPAASAARPAASAH